MKECAFILVYCKWNLWEYGNCSAECGGGLLTQYRAPIKTATTDGGRNCSGERRRLTNIKCNTHSCSGNMCIYKAIDGNV